MTRLGGASALLGVFAGSYAIRATRHTPTRP